MAYGNVEFGTLLDENDHSIVLGRLAIDYDTQEFWQRPSTGDRAYIVNWKNIAHYLAVGAIKYDDPQMEKRLLGFLQRREKNEKIEREEAAKREAHKRQVDAVQRSNKLVAQTRTRAVMARLFWIIGCLIAIAVTFIVTIPPSPPAKADPSIAGYGANYGISNEELKKASYIAALGDATELYGVIVDQDIVEVGTATTGESTIKENVMLNPYVSQQPIHMRPLYYDRQSFYQSSLITNDYSGGSSAVYLQNPTGYKDGLAANELVLTGGPGISAITLASPDAYQAMSADDAASQLEGEQETAFEADYEYEDPDKNPSTPPEGWIGFDSCDIDGNWVVASYWYRQPAILGGNLLRRVIMYDIQNVLNSGSAGVAEMNSVNMNYQIMDASYYAPVVSTSRATNASVHWIAYMKQDSSGGTGFFVRKVQETTDILNESPENNFSTFDITGNRAPITNYTLDGDMLFYEQSGYIWYFDLSKLEATVDQFAGKKTVKKNKATQICDTQSIYPTQTRDEMFAAAQTGTAPVPRSHYRVMKIITSEGIEYGITFIDATTGNLVFCPTHAIVVAGQNESDLTANNNAQDVQDQTQAEIDRLKREEEGLGEYAEGYDPTANQQQNPQLPTDMGVATSTNGHEARALQVSDTIPISDMDAPPARARQVVDTTITKVIVALANRGDSSVSIIAWTVRGEHVIWIEEDMATHERAVKCSPVYYKNDAVKVTEQIFGEENEDESNELSQVEQNQINQGEQFQEQLAQEQAQQNIQQPVADPTQAQPQVDAQAQQQAETQPATDMTQVSNPPATDMSQAPDSMMTSPVDQQPTSQQGIAGW